MVDGLDLVVPELERLDLTSQAHELGLEHGGGLERDSLAHPDLFEDLVNLGVSYELIYSRLGHPRSYTTA